MVYRHGRRVIVAVVALFLVAQIPPSVYQKWAVPAFIIAGQYVVNGAQSPDLWRSVMKDIKNKDEH